MALLGWARILVAWVPLEKWRNSLGCIAAHDDPPDKAKPFAADVEWAAKRLPFATKCLPRAMALSWLLRDNRIGHAVVIAVRPSELRNSPDALHAWVEVGGWVVLGDLPGPWAEIARLCG